jgi:hypothetical protein
MLTGEGPLPMRHSSERRRPRLRALALATVLAGCGTGWLPSPHGRSAPEVQELVEEFDGTWTLAEAGNARESPSERWWLNSGARLEAFGGLARTVHGALPATDSWRLRYARSNSRDTDGGRYPQNLFRLVSQSTWKDVSQEVRFRISRVNESESPERNGWSGIFLFQRFQSGATTYYSGLRVDGTAIVKRKLDGRYVTLAQERVFGTAKEYDRRRNPILLPVGRWLEMRSLVVDDAGGGVRIDLFVRDPELDSEWRRVVSVIDDGADGPPIREAGSIGLRTDFMDVAFDRLVVREPPEPSAPGSIAGPAGAAIGTRRGDQG